MQRSNDRRRRGGCRGTPYFWRHDRELVFKAVISLRKSWGGYRRMTPRLFRGLPGAAYPTYFLHRPKVRFRPQPAVANGCVEPSADQNTERASPRVSRQLFGGLPGPTQVPEPYRHPVFVANNRNRHGARIYSGGFIHTCGLQVYRHVCRMLYKKSSDGAA